MIKLIMPLWRILESKEDQIEIIGFKDEANQVYNSLDDLFINLASDCHIFTYFYQPFIAYLQKWGKDRNIYEPEFKPVAKYGSRSTKDYMFFCHTSSNPTEGSPITRTAKIQYQGKKFNFYNFHSWIHYSNDFMVSDEEREHHYQILMTLYENFIVPYWLPYVKSQRLSSFPKTLAALGRQMFNNPIKFKSLERNRWLSQIKGSYRSGLTYISMHAYQGIVQPLYDYDIKSMYPYLLMNRNYPNITYTPEQINHFVEVDNVNSLAHYHITGLEAVLKPNAIPCLFTGKEERKRFLRITSGTANIYNDGYTLQLINLPSNCLDTWITSVDYEMLITYYDIITLTIDKTILYKRLISGSRFINQTNLNYVYLIKETTEDALLKECSKLLLNSFTGSIGMYCSGDWRIDNLIEPQHTPVLLPADREAPAWDISSFMTAYGRQMIMQKAMEVGGAKNVIAIITDGFYTLTPLELPLLENNMGALKLDKVMHNSKWFAPNQYEWQDEERNWNGAIAGLPKALYKHNQFVYDWNIVKYDPLMHNYYKIERNFNIGGED